MSGTELTVFTRRKIENEREPGSQTTHWFTCETLAINFTRVDVRLAIFGNGYIGCSRVLDWARAPLIDGRWDKPRRQRKKKDFKAK